MSTNQHAQKKITALETELTALRRTNTILRLRASHSNTRALASLDTIDALQTSHAAELNTAYDRTAVLEKKIARLKGLLKETQEERDDLRDAVERFIEKVEVYDGVHTLPRNTFQFSQLAEPGPSNRSKNNNLSHSLTAPPREYSQELLQISQAELAREKAEHRLTWQDAASQIAALKAQVARRDLELESLLQIGLTPEEVTVPNHRDGKPPKRADREPLPELSQSAIRDLSADMRQRREGLKEEVPRYQERLDERDTSRSSSSSSPQPLASSATLLAEVEPSPRSSRHLPSPPPPPPPLAPPPHISSTPLRSHSAPTPAILPSRSTTAPSSALARSRSRSSQSQSNHSSSDGPSTPTGPSHSHSHRSSASQTQNHLNAAIFTTTPLRPASLPPLPSSTMKSLGPNTLVKRVMPGVFLPATPPNRIPMPQLDDGSGGAGAGVRSEEVRRVVEGLDSRIEGLMEVVRELRAERANLTNSARRPDVTASPEALANQLAAAWLLEEECIRLHNGPPLKVEEPEEVHRLTSADPRRFHTPLRTQSVHVSHSTVTPSTFETPIRRSSNAHLMELSASQGFGAAALLSPVHISRSLPRTTPPRFTVTNATLDGSYADDESSTGFSEFTELDGGHSDSFTGRDFDNIPSTSAADLALEETLRLAQEELARKDEEMKALREELEYLQAQAPPEFVTPSFLHPSSFLEHSEDPSGSSIQTAIARPPLVSRNTQ